MRRPQLVRARRRHAASLQADPHGCVGAPSALRAAELLNGSNRPGEQERAEKLLSRLRLAGTGGSDAHLVSAIGKCMTRFATTVSSEAELVAGLRQGGFHAVQLDETLQAQP